MLQWDSKIYFETIENNTTITVVSVFFNDLYSTAITVVIYEGTLTFEIRDIAVPVPKCQNVLKWLAKILIPIIKKLK